MSDAGNDFELGQNDDQVVWDVPIYDKDGNQIDITGATVRLHYRIDDDSAAAVEHDGAVVGTSPLTKARYVFPAAETATPGTYKANFLILLAGERFSYPPDRHLILEILPQV